MYNCSVGVDCQFANGNDILTFYGVSLNTKTWLYAIYMIITGVLLHAVAFLAVTYMYTGAAAEWTCVQERRNRGLALTEVVDI